MAPLLAARKALHSMGKRHTWRATRGWHTHSIACWDAEWAEWKAAAELQGKSVNGWVREWLSEAVKYERLVDRDDTPTAA